MGLKETLFTDLDGTALVGPPALRTALPLLPVGHPLGAGSIRVDQAVQTFRRATLALRLRRLAVRGILHTADVRPALLPRGTDGSSLVDTQCLWLAQLGLPLSILERFLFSLLSCLSAGESLFLGARGVTFLGVAVAFFFFAASGGDGVSESEAESESEVGVLKRS